MHARPRMLMNSQPNDGAPGGVPSTGQAAPDQAPAQGTPEPSLIDQISKLMDAKLAEQENKTFASLRKAGVFGGKAAKAEPEATPPPPTPTEEVQSIIARERTFTRAIAKANLTDGQLSRMERAFQAEKPDDPAGWARDYLSDLGVQQQPGSGGQQPQPPATPRTGPPASNGGPPAPVTAQSDQAEVWRFSEDDVRSLIRQKGMAGAGAELRMRLRQNLNGRSVRLK